MYKNKEDLSRLWNIGFSTIRELETERGILASGKEEIFGCIFGRDSLITSLKLLKAYQSSGDEYLLSLTKKILLNIVKLQGTEINIESGEEPGKCIHEFRPNNHEHLTKSLAHPWYVYPDNVMRNYDTVDATPLMLIAIYEYYRLSKDQEFLKQVLPNVHSALNWILEYGDSNNDGFIDYHFSSERTFGGLKTQSWMDSVESIFHEDGQAVEYPIAPIEVQAYTYVALRAWSSHLNDLRLASEANRLKELFNQKFIIKSENGVDFAFAIDGNDKPLIEARSSIGHCLWSIWEDADGKLDSIVENEFIDLLVKRITSPDLFEPLAGVRTLSVNSSKYDPYSYHNGSVWPHDTAIVITGLENFGYHEEASLVRKALLSAYNHFQTPIELFVFTEGSYHEYCSGGGQTACKKQAWSAASLLESIAVINSK